MLRVGGSPNWMQSLLLSPSPYALLAQQHHCRALICWWAHKVPLFLWINGPSLHKESFISHSDSYTVPGDPPTSPGCSRVLSRTASAISRTAAGAVPHSSVQDELMFAGPCTTKKGALVRPLVLTDYPGTLNHVERQESKMTFPRATPCLYSWQSFRRGVQSSDPAPNSLFRYNGPSREASHGTVLHTACPACRHSGATVQTTALSPIAPEPRADINARTQKNIWKL